KEFDSKKLIKEIRAISKRTGVSERDVTLASSDALSARGDKPARKALESVETALQLLPFNAEAGKQLSGAILDVSKTANLSMKQAAGGFISISRAARVTGMQGTAEHIAPATIGVMGFGDSFQQAGALV